MRKIAILSIIVLGIAFGTFAYLSGSLGAAVSPRIILYSGESYSGRSVVLTETTFDLPVILRSEGGGEEFNWNDEIRSVEVVSGTWRLYQNGRCNTKLDETRPENFDVTQKAAVGGWSTLVSATSRGPLRIPSVAAGGFWRDISSVELVSEANLPDWALDFRK